MQVDMLQTNCNNGNQLFDPLTDSNKPAVLEISHQLLCLWFKTEC